MSWVSLFLLAFTVQTSIGFCSREGSIRNRRSNSSMNNMNRVTTVRSMGFFDGIANAFSNEDFKSQDQRVRASHILIKGDDIDQVLRKVKELLAVIQDRTTDDSSSSLLQVFSELARQESACPSASKGGDLGLFGPGKMVSEFDTALFPDGGPAPPVGTVLAPIVTDFGCHIILVTQREESKDQVEEKLARIDPDAMM